MVWGVAIATKKCTKPSTYMLRELETIRTKLLQLFGEAERIEGVPKEVCMESMAYAHGVSCFGYLVRHEVGEWGLTVCGLARVLLEARVGSVEKTIWVDDCDIKGMFEHKGNLDIYSKTNKVFYCAVESLESS